MNVLRKVRTWNIDEQIFVTSMAPVWVGGIIGAASRGPQPPNIVGASLEADNENASITWGTSSCSPGNLVELSVNIDSGGYQVWAAGQPCGDGLYEAILPSMVTINVLFRIRHVSPVPGDYSEPFEVGSNNP